MSSPTSAEGPDLKNPSPEESKVIEEIKKALKNDDKAKAVEITQKYLENKNNIPLNIAVTGDTGSGKSTFVNVFRGIDNNDERAARTGVVETTIKSEPFQHPIYPNVTLWDLPGIGSTNFPADQYLKYVDIDKFDFFIIVSEGRFRENDAKLAQEIKKMDKKFYFVRSKIDNNLRDAKRSPEYDEEKTLQQIRENCIQGLKQQGVASPQVFLVSHFDLHLYDFPTLQETMERELPSHKKHVLTLALSSLSKSTINKKKEFFHSQIKYYAALVAAVPVPGLSIVADLGILVGVLPSYLFGFGLDKKSLEKLSRDTNTPLEDLRDVMKSDFSGVNVTLQLVKTVLQAATLVGVCTAAEEVTRYIPFVGFPIAAGLSFTSVYMFLSTTLDSLSVDAENVLTKALEIKVSGNAFDYSGDEQ